MKITRYAMILACILFLQGCKIFATSIPAEPPVSVTRIQFGHDESRWRWLEIVFSSKRGFGGFVENISLSGVAAFCSESDKKLRNAMIVKVYLRNLVGKKYWPSVVPEPDGSYIYSILVSVSSEGIGDGVGGIPDGVPYDLADVPQDVCSRSWSTHMMLWYGSNWIAIPQEMIDRGLALPPDPERSAAWLRQRIYESGLLRGKNE